MNNNSRITKKNILVFLFVAIFVLCSFAGCGEKTENKESQQTTRQNESKATFDSVDGNGSRIVVEETFKNVKFKDLKICVDGIAIDPESDSVTDIENKTKLKRMETENDNGYLSTVFKKGDEEVIRVTTSENLPEILVGIEDSTLADKKKEPHLTVNGIGDGIVSSTGYTEVLDKLGVKILSEPSEKKENNIGTDKTIYSRWDAENCYLEIEYPDNEKDQTWELKLTFPDSDYSLHMGLWADMTIEQEKDPNFVPTEYILSMWLSKV